LEEWTNGAMFATGALSAGVSINGILDVFHVGVPHGMIAFVQESGRAGRQGEIVRSRILLANWELVRLRELDTDEMEDDERVMREMILAEGCRRSIMGEYMNGEALGCMDLDAEECDNCSKDIGEVRQEKRRLEGELEKDEVRKVRRLEERGKYVKKRGQDEGDMVEMIEFYLQWCKRYCGACWVVEGQKVNDHTAERCGYLRRLIGGEYGNWKSENIKYENQSYWLMNRFTKNTCCYTCGLPGDMCELYRERKGCGNADIMLAMCMVAFLDGDRVMSDLVRDVSGRGFRVDTYVKWLVKYANVLGENGTNCFKLFIAILKKRKELDEAGGS